MLVRLLGRDATARSATEESLLEQVGLVDVLDRVARFGHGCGDRLDADRSAFVVLDQDFQDSAVLSVEAGTIDFEPRAGVVDDRFVDPPAAVDLRKVASAPEQAVGDARSSARAFGQRAGAGRRALDL